MATYNLLLLPGDGIGPEVMAEVKRIIDLFNRKGIDKFETEEGLVGGCATTRMGWRSPKPTWRRRKPRTR